jgi:hypothetical protein
VNCSSHSRNKALRVLCCDLAKRRACQPFRKIDEG